MARVVHFDVMSQQPERLVEFCSSVFGWRFEKWTGPMEYWLTSTGEPKQPGIDGGLGRGRPVDRLVLTVTSVEIDRTLAAVVAAGGAVERPKGPIPGGGRCRLRSATCSGGISASRPKEAAGTCAGSCLRPWPRRKIECVRPDARNHRRKEVMEMSDPTKRIAKWDAKFDTERIKGALDDLRPTMLGSVQSVTPQLVSMEGQVKQVLDAEAVATIQYPFYLSFGRQVWRLIRQEVSGDSLAKEVAVLVTKWKDRGLSQAVLELIRTQVFNVGAPTP
ncbi:hypothetical protein FJY71_04725 [candidate division WOR-3 bacterium]|nr:hypothetical protein [candidate division WOR-3 bacterium]